VTLLAYVADAELVELQRLLVLAMGKATLLAETEEQYDAMERIDEVLAHVVGERGIRRARKQGG